MLQDEAGDAIVGLTIAVAHQLGLTVVAEGVEDADTVAALRRHRCDTIQGFWWCRPAPADVITAWLSRRREGRLEGGTGLRVDDVERTAEVRRDAAGDGEAEAGATVVEHAGVVEAREGLEDACPIDGGDGRSVVPHPQPDDAVGRRAGSSHLN
jgi:predicted signal transduction protein with EAL and GGDEF domain